MGRWISVFVLAYLTFFSYSYAQQCDSRYPLSSPTENFLAENDGTVTDLESGLTWMRCSVGQQWNQTSCEGRPLAVTLSEATTHIANLNRKEKTRWRIPRLTELALIVERQCTKPRINLTVFPNTAVALYWSTTPSASKQNEYLVMDFDDRGVRSIPVNQRLYIRLVRGRD